MGVMYDAVDPANIPAQADGLPALRITVFAHQSGEAFDVEGSNAPAPIVATAMRHRLDVGWWSVGYVNESTYKDLTAAMAALGLAWTDATEWPKPGVYLWAADPDDNIGKGVWQVSVWPLAIQRRYFGSHDESDTAANFPAAAAGYIDGPQSEWPADAWSRFTVLEGGGATLSPPQAPPPPAPPAPPAPEVTTVLLPVLKQGSEGPSVKALQKLFGGLVTDGIFGPITEAAVRGYQSREGLTVDGVVGAHTWGSLLGAPQ